MKPPAIDCPCGYGTNLGPENKTCPICGLNLEPLHRIYSLSTGYFEKGVQYFDLGDFEKARQMFMTSLSLEENKTAELYDYIARCCFAVKDFENAEKYLRHAEEKNSENPELRNSIKRITKNNSIKKLSFAVTGCLAIILSISVLALAFSISGSHHEVKQLKETITSQTEIIRNINQQKVRASENSDKDENYSILYLVKPGESLSQISHSVYGTDEKWEKIFNANKDKLKDPDKLREKEIIVIPFEKADIRH